MFSGLANVVTCSENIPSYYCISPHWHNRLELCKLSFVDEPRGQFYLIFGLFIFRAKDGPTAQNPPPAEYFNLFVVCSWMQVMELSARRLGDSCVRGTGVYEANRQSLRAWKESALNIKSGSDLLLFIINRLIIATAKDIHQTE